MSKVKTPVYETWIYLKYTAEGMTDLGEVAGALEDEAKLLREMEATGKIIMTNPVDNGHVYLETSDAEVAAQFGMEVSEWFEDQDVEDE